MLCYRPPWKCFFGHWLGTPVYLQCKQSLCYLKEVHCMSTCNDNLFPESIFTGFWAFKRVWSKLGPSSQTPILHRNLQGSSSLWQSAWTNHTIKVRNIQVITRFLVDTGAGMPRLKWTWVSQVSQSFWWTSFCNILWVIIQMPCFACV